MAHTSYKDRAYYTAYLQWVKSLPESEQRKLAELGLSKPSVPGKSADVGMEEDAAMMAVDQSEVYAAMDELEAQPELQEELGSGLADALLWVADGQTLVAMGQRLAAMLHVWKPALLAGLTLEIQNDLAEACVEMEEPGPEIAAVFEWISRGGSLSQWGQRFMAASYVMAPTVINSPTLERIGAMNRKTRQGIDRLVQDFRDTFGGIKAGTMRPDTTRVKCQNSQLKRKASAN